MILSMTNQALLFLYSVIFGFVVGFFYDILRVFRRIIKHHKILIHIEDFLYWIFLTATLFFIMLSINNGEIRFFLFPGVFIGMILYYHTVSGLFLKTSDKIIKLIKTVLLFAIRLILLPLKSVYDLFKKIFFLIFGGLIYKIKNYKKSKNGNGSEPVEKRQ